MLEIEPGLTLEHLLECRKRYLTKKENYRRASRKYYLKNREVLIVRMREKMRERKLQEKAQRARPVETRVVGDGGPVCELRVPGEKNREY
jgi:hypothetical protein